MSNNPWLERHPQFPASWNGKLRDLQQAQQEYEQQRATDQHQRDQTQRQQILALAQDFPRLWNDPHTPQRERKRMVRLLLEDVTLLKGQEFTLHIRFKGGATRTLTQPKALSAPKLRKTKPDLIEKIDRLLDEGTEAEVAAHYNDFRDVLARQDIDAVAIVVPDHWHALMVVMAAKAGKDMYCEKPLSLTIRQGQAMVKAVREQKRILQTGSHYRSSPDNRLGCELVRNGRIGQVQRILTQVAEINAMDPGPGWQPTPIPEGFDYEFWLGPAPKAPYHKDRCFYRFRFNLDYSGGQVTNFGAHSNDAAQWALGLDQSGPIEIEDQGSEWPPKGGLYNTATKTAFRARYANGVELICKTDRPGFGIRFEGSDGWVEYGYQGLKTYPESLKTSKISDGEIHLPVSNPDRTKETSEYHVPDHVRNFLDSIKSRHDPVAPVEGGHRSATVCHLGNIAMLLKRKLRWNPAQEQFLDDDEANRMLTRPMRAPWQLS